MIKRFFAVTVLCCALFGTLSSYALAATFFERPPNEKPDVLSYGWRGMLLGALTGLAAGYVRYIDTNGPEVLKSLAYGTVVGAGVGIIAGLNDASLGYQSTGDILLRDMTLGGWFGVVVGGVWGGVEAINKSDLTAFGQGASWGYIFGVAGGLGIGIYESVRGYSSPSVRTSSKKTGTSTYITFFEDSRGNHCPALAFANRF